MSNEADQIIDAARKVVEAMYSAILKPDHPIVVLRKALMRYDHEKADS